MDLEHLEYIRSVPLAAHGLSTLYLRLAQNLASQVGVGTPGRAFKVHSSALEINLFNRANEPLELAVIVYFLLNVCELIDGGLVGSYTGELVCSRCRDGI